MNGHAGGAAEGCDAPGICCAGYLAFSHGTEILGTGVQNEEGGDPMSSEITMVFVHPSHPGQATEQPSVAD